MAQASGKHNRRQDHVAARPLKLWQDTSTAQEVRIEIIPLIDVIFCILTFFILAAVGFSRQQAIGLSLPQASTGTPQMREILVVSLDDLGQVYVEKQAVTRNQLQQAIRNYHQLNPGGLMVLNASRSASYNEVIEVLDLLREVGGDRVALATLPESESATAEPIPNSNPYLPIPGGSFNPLQPNVPIPNQGSSNPLPPNYSPAPPSSE
ncbi:MAG: ExbD/TolR family protein [Cyanophyceae cyanobacterium]